MGDLRAGTPGSDVIRPTGKRVARHCAEQVTAEPYVGRRVAGARVATPAPAAPATPVEAPAAAPVVGRRRAEPAGVPPVPPSPFSEAPPVGRRALRDDVVPFAVVVPVEPPAPVAETPAPVVEAPAPVVETPAPVVETPAPVVEPEVTLVLEQVLEASGLLEPVPTEPEPGAPEPVVALAPVTHAPARHHRPVARTTSRRTAAGRRAARRRSPVPLPSAPLLVGVAILGISAGGALQAMHPDLAGASDAHHLAPASALSGTSAVGSASLLGDRSTVVSRSADRLQAAADAQAKQRAETLSGFASQAQKKSHEIRLHAWVLPVQPGVYHLTARFGDYSSLWSNFHTGLDFAAPTGTPIMAVAGGTITEVGYSGAYGNRTIERLPDGTELWYCHQNEFGTSVGATVHPGEVIGYVGSTGNVTGPHLHLEVHPGGGDAVDPYAALVAHGLYPGPPN